MARNNADLKVPGELLAIPTNDFLLSRGVQVFCVEQQAVHVKQTVSDVLQQSMPSVKSAV